MTLDDPVYENQYSFIMRFLADDSPPYLGQPLASQFMSLGDATGGFVADGIRQGRVRLEDAGISRLVLQAISASFGGTHRIIREEDRQPVRVIAILDSMINESGDADIVLQAKRLRDQLAKLLAALN